MSQRNSGYERKERERRRLIRALEKILDGKGDDPMLIAARALDEVNPIIRRDGISASEGSK
jgi:hypothetical protein